MRKEEDADCYSHDNISLKMASYNDIFSSFDPRPYSERALSVDFIEEAKRASIDKPSGEIELRLILDEKDRDADMERIIQKRLKVHFERHAKKIRDQFRAIVRNGTIFTVSGIIIMFLASFFLFRYSESNLFIHFLLILFEPAGWFFFWEGLDQVVFESKKKTPELEFYEKMVKSDVIFMSC
jgi:hypothetical protein